MFEPIANSIKACFKSSSAFGLNERNEAIRVTLVITFCMLVGKVFNFDSSVYLALYPTIVMTKVKDYCWSNLVRTFAPTLVCACVALLVVELFQSHPFVVWSISLIFIDWMRKKADTPAKRGGMIMPVFNWILIVIFAQFSSQSMPDRIGEILLSMVITVCVAKAAVWLFPVNSKISPMALKPQRVTYQQRLVTIGLIGAGIALLMNINLLSATFCMVPVIAAATQSDRRAYKEVVSRRFITQIGGCAVAVLVSVLLAGHQAIIGYYALIVAGAIFAIAAMMVTGQNAQRDIHADALLATVLPIQLYIATMSMGLESIFLRAWELAVTLAILFLLFQLSNKREHNVTNKPDSA
ncbi:DUF2955 domain-containing protein [Shewanella pealeana]|uniref:DUF2955 domain-containing protein n=1 Tax=Shewanella pealeana (strain ATCC 700345 / ANG-SQ1) TaxID=398579 RepID=A8H2U1_SHEPA|nr:DUF2955 domain-containing protein [Shewanella pealeana]ABV86878.1 conserved hypothetical protein [Shewanella pealeana ATCC 700345]